MVRKLIIITLVSSFAFVECPDDKLCLNCVGDECKSCYQSYADSEGVCVKPKTEIEKCVSYKSESACASCDWGYELKDGKCHKIAIKNCNLVINGVSGCAGCDSGIEVEGGKCDGSKKCTDSNCDLCTVGACVECKSGYSVSGKTAQCVKEPNSHCWLTESDESKCNTCHLGYYDNDKTCQKSSFKMLINIISVFVIGLFTI